MGGETEGGREGMKEGRRGREGREGRNEGGEKGRGGREGGKEERDEKKCAQPPNSSELGGEGRHYYSFVYWLNFAETQQP